MMFFITPPYLRIREAVGFYFVLPAAFAFGKNIGIIGK